MLSVCRHTLLNEQKRGRLKLHKIAGRVGVLPAELQRYVQSRPR